MQGFDDDLLKFEADGALPLPLADREGYAECDGARIWYASYGVGPSVILLHGGFGNAGNWGYQVPALVKNGYQVVVVDSRGHGRSTRDDRPYSYDQMAADVLQVMETLELEKAAFVGWSDGACTALVLGSKDPRQVAGVFFFACNMDPSGTKQITDFGPILRRCFSRHTKDYSQLSPTPDQFGALGKDLELMQKTQPNYSFEDLGKIEVPVTIVQSEHDEFIKPEHAEYLAASIPNAELVLLSDVSHFAPLQRPNVFNQAVLMFLAKVLPTR